MFIATVGVLFGVGAPHFSGLKGRPKGKLLVFLEADTYLVVDHSLIQPLLWLSREYPRYIGGTGLWEVLFVVSDQKENWRLPLKPTRGPKRPWVTCLM